MAQPGARPVNRQSSVVNRQFVYLTIFAALVASSALSAQQGSSAGWPQFRGNPRLTGVAGSAPPATLKLLWSHETRDMIDSSPAVAGGAVYVGLGNGELVAVDLATGGLRWKYASGNIGGESSPAVWQDMVYFGDLDGVVHAVGAADGRRIWTFKTSAEIKASPVVASGLVVIGSYDTHLYALDARTGALRWKFQTKGQVHATPAVVGDLLFIAGCDGVFRAIRVADGRQAYAIETGSYTGASPVIEGDRAYFGTFDYEVLALDLKARKVIWRYANPDRKFPFYSSAALDRGRVILGGRDKFVHAIDAASGRKAWTFETRARVDSSPAVAGGRVYVGSGDGRFYVLDQASGRKLWEFETGSGITASPAIVDGKVVVASTDGVIYCFG
jgi:outer membrane protein assembly factor BamB